jgi:hypothetical protein
MPQGARNQALIAYGKVAAKAGMASEAAREVMELRKAAGLFAYEALIEVGPPALPQLMWVLSSCSDKQGQTGSLMDPKATIEMDEGTMAAAGVALIVEKHPAAPESKEAAPGLVRALGCGDSRVRMGAARALAMQERLEKPELVALRRLLRSDKRPHTRGLVAGVLGSVAPRDAESLGALDSALGDRAELVQLAAATALVRLGRDGRARATLEKLGKSKDPEISKLADNVSKEAAASPSAARDPGKPR